MRAYKPRLPKRPTLTAEQQRQWRAHSLELLTNAGFRIEHLNPKTDRELAQMKNRFLSRPLLPQGKLNTRPYHKKWR